GQVARISISGVELTSLSSTVEPSGGRERVRAADELDVPGVVRADLNPDAGLDAPRCGEEDHVATLSVILAHGRFPPGRAVVAVLELDAQDGQVPRWQHGDRGLDGLLAGQRDLHRHFIPIPIRCRDLWL